MTGHDFWLMIFSNRVRMKTVSRLITFRHWLRQAGLTMSCTCRPLFSVIATCAVALVSVVVAGQPGQVTRFQSMAQYLQDASPELRRDFAAAALSSVASAYRAEANLARNESRKSSRHESLRTWSATVDGFARQMPLLLEDIELGLPVDLTLGAEKSLAITVAGRTVILSHPRLNEQNAFEQEIIVAFCATHNCEGFMSGNGDLEPIAVSAAPIRSNWTFTSQESLCAYHGITLRFRSAVDIARARLVCEQLLQEVVTLANELTWQQRHSVDIEWGQLAIRATPLSPGHIVQLNAMGDSILVTVPLLYSSPELLSDVLPWLNQRVSNQQEVDIVLDADRYGWQNR